MAHKHGLLMKLLHLFLLKQLLDCCKKVEDSTPACKLMAILPAVEVTCISARTPQLDEFIHKGPQFKTGSHGG